MTTPITYIFLPFYERLELGVPEGDANVKGCFVKCGIRTLLWLQSFGKLPHVGTNHTCTFKSRMECLYNKDEVREEQISSLHY